MTSAQFDILIRDQDINMPGAFVFEGKAFDLGDSLFRILNIFFTWYANLALDDLKEETEIRLTDINDENEKMNYLSDTKQNELKKLYLVNKQSGYEISLKDAKNCWHLLIENDQLLDILQYLKFEVWEGGKIPMNHWPSTPTDFCILENYFISNKLQQAYEVMRIEIKISFLEDLMQSLQTSENRNSENSFLQSTVEDWLFDFKNLMSESNYSLLVKVITTYLIKGEFPKMDKVITISKINKKRFGWALNQIYRSQKSGPLPKEILIFAKENISIFQDVEFDEQNFKKSNLYKYFTTNPH